MSPPEVAQSVRPTRTASATPRPDRICQLTSCWRHATPSRSAPSMSLQPTPSTQTKNWTSSWHSHTPNASATSRELTTKWVEIRHWGTRNRQALADWTSNIPVLPGDEPVAATWGRLQPPPRSAAVLATLGFDRLCFPRSWTVWPVLGAQTVQDPGCGRPCRVVSARYWPFVRNGVTGLPDLGGFVSLWRPKFSKISGYGLRAGRGVATFGGCGCPEVATPARLVTGT